MRSNDQSNRLIMWIVTVADFLLLNGYLYTVFLFSPTMQTWESENLRLFFLINSMALFVAEWRFHTIIHERIVVGSYVIRRVLELSVTQIAVAYVILRAMDFPTAVGWQMIMQGIVFFIILVLIRFIELSIIKRYRRRGGNTRTITFAGADSRLKEVYNQLATDPAKGYKVIGYYADTTLLEDQEVPCLGSLDFLLGHLHEPESLQIGDELFVSIPRRETENILRLSRFCERNMVRFFYVPMAAESIPLNFQREYISDIEVLTTHESPLEDPTNRLVKRTCDILFSMGFLLATALIWPFIVLMIKIQSPGPVLFKQQRTGLGGKTFTLLKFRSMHVNSDADKVQATKDDARVFPFGRFLRKTSLDELPQFWNVLRGDMSIVGPRPHMLAHTEIYSKLIDKYMVRHFVKPGITGWAQVTGYRGETKELWQMEGRVQRDIWYMEHWNIWLDIRILWLTAKSILKRDKNAY